MLNIETLRQFKESQYARHLVFKSDNVEIIMVCWRPGQGSPIHHHGPSDGLMVILDGEITNTSYYPDGKKVTTVWRKGDVGHTPIGVSHEVRNNSRDDVVSFHIYAPPLAKEFKSADLGYDNNYTVCEAPLPGEVVRYLMGVNQASVPYQLLDPGL